MSGLRVVADEVLIASASVVQVAAADLADVVRRATCGPRKRARLCAHPDAADPLHEMLLCLASGTYIRPHRHAGKSESFHIIEGELDVVLFHDDGTIREVVRMGPYHMGKTFFYRLMEPCFHTVLVNAPYVLLHETTNGPFDSEDTEFAPWAPAEGAPNVGHYLDNIRGRIAA
jgi:cupin fold WbuC family metalloprotein